MGTFPSWLKHTPGVRVASAEHESIGQVIEAVFASSLKKNMRARVNLNRNAIFEFN